MVEAVRDQWAIALAVVALVVIVGWLIAARRR
jgi:hypothetical protein